MDQIKINKNNFNWSWTWTEEKHSSQPERLSSTTKFKWMQIRDATTTITILHKPVIKCNSTNSPQTEWNIPMLIKSIAQRNGWCLERRFKFKTQPKGWCLKGLANQKVDAVAGKSNYLKMWRAY